MPCCLSLESTRCSPGSRTPTLGSVTWSEFSTAQRYAPAGTSGRRPVRAPPPLPFSARQVFTPQALVYVDADKVPDITPGKAHALAQAI